MTTYNIRLATVADSGAMLEIYAPYVRETVISFEYDPPTLLDFSNRVANILEHYPWLVAEIDGVIVGYAYASRYSERAAYQWSVDASVYIHSGYHRQKIASTLYSCLFDLLKLQGFYNVYAGITLSNTTSEQFHTSFGFTRVGVFHHVGYKFGQWHDVQWMERSLSEYHSAPSKPQSLAAIIDTPQFIAILNQARQKLDNPQETSRP
ncbi:MAG TPA: GNAT family N-acetyltransferase [Bacillota bacterium]|nr:GNAT family N-acetyltransferase [Bacillota bacterium]